jgi:hypothetical protein
MGNNLLCYSLSEFKVDEGLLEISSSFAMQRIRHRLEVQTAHKGRV